LTIKIWSDHKYGDCDKWILDRVLSNKEFMYVLCSPTVVWELDPLRENPKDRDKLYKIYLENLQKLNLNFIEISGELPERIKLFLTRN
jgi:nicotinamide riboside kinase